MIPEMDVIQEEPRGYNPDSHDRHPGVTVSEEERNGKRVFLLRWLEPLPGGKRGKRKAECAKDGKGRPVSSRAKAHSAAEVKSREITVEAAKLRDVSPSKELNIEATWPDLLASHQSYLRRKLRREATQRGYAEKWKYFDGWRGKPTLPKELEAVHLEEFRAYVDAKPLSKHTVNSVLVHIKAILTHGRRRVKCIRLDSDSISEALERVKAERKPVVLSKAKLRSILEAASNYDANNDGVKMFPILAFMAVTGCRLGEMQALRWNLSKPDANDSWLDFEGGRVVLYGHKTSVTREVPFENRPLLKRMLEALHDVADVKASPFVFGGALPLAVREKQTTVLDKEGKPIMGLSGKAALYAVRKASGDDWKPKDLRSTCASALANSKLYGALTITLADILGHDPDVLKNHYIGKGAKLPSAQRDAATVEEVLGIHDLLESWCKVLEGSEGKIIPMRRTA